MIIEIGGESHFGPASVVQGGAQFAGQSQSETGTCGATRTRAIRACRIVFVDTETSNWAWDPISKSYYWHRFFSHQPDLNFDNPAVFEAVWEVMKFWLNLGVDGFRLDAVAFLVEREGTLCENLPETHAIIREIRKRLDVAYPGTMLLAEANQWPADVRAYFGESAMNFTRHFIFR